MNKALVVAFVWLALLASPARAQDALIPDTVISYQDWWWNANQSGHGLNIGQQGNVVFVSWFTYDEAGDGMWLTMSATLLNQVATGTWTRTTGPALGAVFNPAQVTRATVGTGRLTFTSEHSATLAWTVNNKSGTLALTRMSWATPLPVAGAHAGRVYWKRSGCLSDDTVNLPAEQTYVLIGNRVIVTERFTEISTRVCTMTGTLVPSGSHWSVEGTYSCAAPTRTGTWRGTWLVRPRYIAREERLEDFPQGCIIQQSVVSMPVP